MEMGQDVLRVLKEYLTALATLHRNVADELPHTRAAVAWAKTLLATPAGSSESCPSRGVRSKSHHARRARRHAPCT